MYYLINITTQAKTQTAVEKALQTALNTQPISGYITACVENALEDGLALLGKQGGYIYQDQGSIIPKNLIQKTQDNIAYLIKPTPVPAPQYPCTEDCEFTNNIQKFPDLFSQRYGRNTLPYLLKKDGDLSIQEQLEAYISNYVKDCANISALKTIPDLAGYNITTGTPSSEITFGINDVSVITNFPTTIQIQDNDLTKINQYGAKIKIRFKKIYNALNQIIELDNSYLDFDLTYNPQSGFFTDQKGNTITLEFRELIGANITKTRLQENIHNFIITIKDPFYQIRNQPYIFQFAVQNRPPALDYIPSILVTDTGQQFSLSPSAKDPDEDPVAFFYDGWRKSYLPAFTIDSTDLGYKIFKVTASDAQSQDYQEVRVLVCKASGVIDANICITDCGAELRCNNKERGSLFNTCSHAKDHLQDMCNENCQQADYPLCTEKCSQDQECFNKAPNTLIPNKAWCDNSCSYCTTEIVDVNDNDIIDQEDLCDCNTRYGRFGLLNFDCSPDFTGEFKGKCAGPEEGPYTCS
ncbi:hypothetical protein KY332_02430 [Candidatus Woesearchaeota archaeon]|nr:hypothetical protein [Candidatus Woesearchaeota archaeon]